MTDGSENKAIALAGKIAYDEVEAALVGADSSNKETGNSNGSYERFMSIMGGMNRMGKLR